VDILGIGYLGFESPAYAEWASFGSEVLGFGIAVDTAEDDKSVLLRMDDRRWRISVADGEMDRLAYIGWELTNRTAFQLALQKLESAGVPMIVGDDALKLKRGVLDVVQFCDPVGYKHELFYGQKFHPGSFVPGRPHSGFVADDLGVGHVVLVTPEYPEELDTFLMDVMGFRWFGSGAGPGKFGFFRSKLNHLSHNIAYGMMPGHKGIHHLGIGVKNLDDVGIAYDLVKERGIPLNRTLGRHTQDPVVSFYLQTPSNFFMEYLTEGANISEESHEVNPEQLSVWGHRLVGPMLPSTVAPV
jgi:2,3-dihydroxybiphenyl 1,2-dioxygenase